MARVAQFSSRLKQKHGTKMFKRYIGIKYQLEPHYRPYKRKFDFRLLALHRRSRRYSAINTLNGILSWCEIAEGDRRFQESSWLVSRIELERLLTVVKTIVNDRESLMLLEAELDEDRSCGEWENKRPKRTFKSTVGKRR